MNNKTTTNYWMCVRSLFDVDGKEDFTKWNIYTQVEESKYDFMLLDNNNIASNLPFEKSHFILAQNNNEFCKSKKCPEYIEWEMGYGKCVSCKKMGQSTEIIGYPEDCNFIDEIIKI